MPDLQGELLTRSRLRSILSAAGVAQDDTICVHSAMRRLGYVCGGARTIIEAALDAVGPSGTVMMPAYTRDTADPLEWKYPPAPGEWIDGLLAETPPYDPKLTPTQNVGAVAELFRTYPDVLRSGHPISSVAARGPNAGALTADGPLDNRFGEDSPYGRLVRLGGKVVMLGAPYETMSLMHLSQYHIGWADHVVKRACMTVDGRRQWVEFRDVSFPHDWASRCVENMIGEGIAVRLPCGLSYVLVVSAEYALAFTIDWRKKNRC